MTRRTARTYWRERDAKRVLADLDASGLPVAGRFVLSRERSLEEVHAGVFGQPGVMISLLDERCQSLPRSDSRYYVNHFSMLQGDSPGRGIGTFRQRIKANSDIESQKPFILAMRCAHMRLAGPQNLLHPLLHKRHHIAPAQHADDPLPILRINHSQLLMV